MRLVLDAEAVSALLDPRHPAERKVLRAMEGARRLRREVAIATGTLAELYRGPGQSGAGRTPRPGIGGWAAAP
jgi:hypothetical protein